MKARLVRDVKVTECDWLRRDYKRGEIVYEYFGMTYGCIGSGLAVSEVEGEIPFFELPQDAIERVIE